MASDQARPTDRVERHLRRRNRLAALDDDELRALVGPAGEGQGVWGGSGTALLDGEAVFVKRVPLTDVEVAHPHSTRNLHRLPLFYQYGVGSAGFGAFRELAAHQQATQWVVDGLTAGFTLLHHHRIVERTGEPWAVPMDRDAYLAHWNGDEAVAAYVDARVAATDELWLVSEHLPHTMSQWLVEHQDRAEWVVESLFAVAAVMRAHGMVHFDVHLDNVVTDGEALAVVDFGLALSSSFELTDAERVFLDAHTHYDVGEILGALSFVVHDRPEVVEPPLATVLERYRPVSKLVGRFFTTLRADATKSIRHDEDELVRRLGACGVTI